MQQTVSPGPEHELLGQYEEHTYRPFHVIDNDSEFSIVPEPKRAVTIKLMASGACLLVAPILCYLLDVDRGFCIGFGVFALIASGIFVGMLYRYLSRFNGEAYLIVDKKSGRVLLPRLDACFEKDQVLFFQVLTRGAHVGPKRVKQRVSELNLLTQDDSGRRRWHVFGLHARDWRLARIAKRLVRSTWLPVFHATERRDGKLGVIDLRSTYA